MAASETVFIEPSRRSHFSQEKWLPRLVDFRNWLMSSGEVEILKILTKGLPFAIA